MSNHLYLEVNRKDKGKIVVIITHCSAKPCVCVSVFVDIKGRCNTSTLDEEVSLEISELLTEDRRMVYIYIFFYLTHKLN